MPAMMLAAFALKHSVIVILLRYHMLIAKFCIFSTLELVFDELF